MPPRKKSRTLYYVLLLIILIGAGGGYYYWSMQPAEEPIVAQEPAKPAIDPAQERLQSLQNHIQNTMAALAQAQFTADISPAEQNALRQAAEYLGQEAVNPATETKLADYDDKILNYLMMAARTDTQIMRSEYDYFRQKFQGRMAAYQTEDTDLSAQNLKMVDQMLQTNPANPANPSNPGSPSSPQPDAQPAPPPAPQP